jgi:hypothetical protein
MEQRGSVILPFAYDGVVIDRAGRVLLREPHRPPVQRHEMGPNRVGLEGGVTGEF